MTSCKSRTTCSSLSQIKQITLKCPTVCQSSLWTISIPGIESSYHWKNLGNNYIYHYIYIFLCVCLSDCLSITIFTYRCKEISKNFNLLLPFGICLYFCSSIWHALYVLWGNGAHFDLHGSRQRYLQEMIAEVSMAAVTIQLKLCPFLIFLALGQHLNQFHQILLSNQILSIAYFCYTVLFSLGHWLH